MSGLLTWTCEALYMEASEDGQTEHPVTFTEVVTANDEEGAHAEVMRLHPGAERVRTLCKEPEEREFEYDLWL